MQTLNLPVYRVTITAECECVTFHNNPMRYKVSDDKDVRRRLNDLNNSHRLFFDRARKLTQTFTVPDQHFNLSISIIQVTFIPSAVIVEAMGH